MSLLDEQLKVAQEKGLLVNIYRDHHDDSPRFCRINAVSEYCIYATCFNDDGEYDGVTICRKDHVTRIRWGGTDRESQRRLVERSGIIPAAPEVNLATLKDIIESVQKQFGYVTVAAEAINRDTVYIGEVVSVDAEHLILNEYGSKDAMDRSTLVLDMDEITLIDAMGSMKKQFSFSTTRSNKALQLTRDSMLLN
jgi:hypothetical protein